MLEKKYRDEDLEYKGLCDDDEDDYRDEDDDFQDLDATDEEMEDEGEG
jgi:hypothetical protein